MLTSIRICNFKSFLDVTLKLAPLTLMTGLNSSGKSSVQQALHLPCLPNVGRDGINGHGSLEDMRCRYAPAGQGIELHVASRTGSATWKQEGYNLERLRQTTPVLDTYAFQHISAERYGPRPFLPACKGVVPLSVGVQGEHVISYIKARDSSIIKDARGHEHAEADTFEGQLTAWMCEVCPGIKFDFTMQPQTDTAYYAVGSRHDNTIAERPTNVGFGIAYTLPVVAQLLGSQPGEIVSLENPEAHLHPAGQTKMGELIARAAKAGVQVFVETHSDHLVDGIRIAVRGGALEARNAAVFYLVKDAVSGLSSATRLSINENGSMSNWPTGFFDQSVKNLAQLAEF